MAYRQPEKRQMMLLPSSIDEYISDDDPVRAYDEIVEKIGLKALGIKWEPDKVGCPQYDPMIMLKILVYGYSYGIRSSRKLERAVNHNMSFIWIAGGLKPDYKTISRFRKDNLDGLKELLRRCAEICIKLGLIEGNTLFIDGTRIRGNASLNNQWDEERCQRYLKKIDERIDEIMEECEAEDDEEADEGSWIKLQESLKGKKKLKTKVEKVLSTLQEEGLKQYNSTDPETARMHSIHGSFAGYNAQIVVDDKHGLILSSDVVNANNDLGQFASQVEKANEILEKPCENACADAGYANAGELEKIDAQGIHVVVPTSKQASEKKPDAFDKTRFEYIAEEDCYICPEGNKLPFRRVCRQRKLREYYGGRGSCRNCRNFGVCTVSLTTGRKIIRFENEEIRERLAAQYDEPSSQEIFNRRKEKAELPFGHIKRNLGSDYFLLRGLSGVKAEIAILTSCFNITRLIGMFGVPRLIELMAVFKKMPEEAFTSVI